MFDWDKWQEIFTSIQRHKLRTALTAFGVFWGIFMLVLFLGAGNGLQNGVEYEFRDDATNSIWLRRGTTSMPYNGLPKGRRIEFYNDDYDFLNTEYEEIEYLTGRVYLSGNRTVVYGNKQLSLPLQSVHPDHLYLENTEIVRGRFINDKDLKEFRKVAVIGELARENLFGDENPIGKEIEIGGIVYTIIGEHFDTGGEYVMRMIYIPITTAQKVYNGDERIHQLMLTTAGLTVPEMNVLEDEIRAAFAKRLEFDVEDTRALYIFNLAEEFEQFQNLFWAIRMFVWFVGLGSIIAGVIGVSNIMLIVVKDRTKEIGIRKALGATPASIIGMILQESIFITALAGYAGLLLGVVFIGLMGSMEVEYFRNPQVNFGIGIAATLVMVIAGALAGVMPAMQAARINPVVAMKTE